MITTINRLTQLDYIKCLIEDNKIGEALGNLKSMCKDMECLCIGQADAMNGDNAIEIPKSLVKTKPQNWVFLNETWVKLIGMKDNVIHLEVSDGITIKNKYVIRHGENS